MSVDLQPLMPHAAANARPLWLRFFQYCLKWASGLLFLVLILMLLAWLGLHYFILPNIEKWRPEIEAQVSRAVGVSVRIGHMGAESRAWIPTIELHDVVLLNAQKQVTLKLPRILAALSPRSMVALEPRFQQILIEGADLDIDRDAHGQFLLAGMPVTQPGDTENMGLNWLMQQSEVTLLKSTIHLTDHLRPSSPLVLSNVDLVIRNTVGKHAFRLDATPPPAVGDRLSIRGQFTEPLLKRSGNWQSWSGTFYVELPNIDVKELKNHVTLPFAVQEGFGATRVWMNISQGALKSLTIDAALANITAQISQNLQPLLLQKIEGRLQFEPSGEQHRLALQQFGFTTQSGIKWPRSNLTLSWLQAPGQAVRGGEVSAEWLDFGLLAQLAEHLPLTSPLRHTLATRRPAGKVNALSVQWQGPMENPAQYQISGHFKNLALQAVAAEQKNIMGLPGMESLNVNLSATEKGGRADVQMEAGKINFPGLFNDPLIPVQQLQARLEWRIEQRPSNSKPSVLIKVPQFKLTNEDGQLEAEAVWSNNPQSQPGEPDRGYLDLHGKLLPGARAERVPRYLPLMMGASLLDYLPLALRGGQLGEVGFKVKGNLKDFPFAASSPGGQPTGKFRIAGRVEDLTLNYAPTLPAQGNEPPVIAAWPPLSKVNGDLVFERDRLSIRHAQAQYKNVQLSKIQAEIQDLGHDSRLTVEGVGFGPLNDMLSFTKHSPVARWTQFPLSEASASGPAEIRLALSVPLAHLTESTLKGSIILLGNDVQLNRELPLLGSTKGQIDFTQKGFKLVDLRTRLAGGETRIDGGWQFDTGLRIVAQGQLTAEGLRKIPEWPGVSQAAQWLSGQTHYRLNLGLSQGRPDISLTSDGIGLGIHLPAPLRRSIDAQAPWPLQLQITPQRNHEPHQNLRHDTLSFVFGPALRAIYQRDVSGAEPQVLRGQLWVSDSPTEAASPTLPITSGSGVVADVALQTINLDEWQNVIRLTGGRNSLSGSSFNTSAYLPSKISLRADELFIDARRIEKLSAQMTQEAEVWRAALDAPQISGKVEYRPARREAPSRVMARFERLYWPPAEAAGGSSILQDNTPDHLPTLDIVVNNFEFRGKKLGRLEMEAAPSAASTQDWKVSHLSLITPEATIKAQGQWGVPDSHGHSSRRMSLDFKLDLKDAGLLIDRLGWVRIIKGGKGAMSGQISWAGSPFTLDYQIMSGQMKVAINSGQFLKADPGAARLLGVLSLQSLPRRLILDFRDIFQEGFAFDNITGDITLFNSIASTTNLRMRGVQAVVLMEGNADLRHETQDLRVFVVPEINAGTASLAYAVINPGIGLGTFVAQLFLRKPLAQAGTREFHISGSWSDPQVERIENKIETHEIPPSPTMENPSDPGGASPMPISPDTPH